MEPIHDETLFFLCNNLQILDDGFMEDVIRSFSIMFSYGQLEIMFYHHVFGAFNSFTK